MVEYVTFDELAVRCLGSARNLPKSQRLMIALAGAPGSGKSTLAARLVDTLNASLSQNCRAVAIPMDGFHLDNAILAKREQLPVKGSPDTFDVAGFHSLLQRLRAPLADSETLNEHAAAVYIPLFDRSMDLARMAADQVGPQHRVLIIEGNYLLLERSPWNTLRELFDFSVMLDVSLSVLEERLTERWLEHGLDGMQAQQRALSNDIPNARVVLAESGKPDLAFKSVRY
ncbi:MAG: AAA family ATPase [Granulosicoccus sp.]